MIKDLILPKSMLCVVKKYSMNGCEMSSLFLGHFYFIKWYLKEKDQEKTKPNWKNFGKKRMTNSHFLASSPSILKRFLASPLHPHVNDRIISLNHKIILINALVYFILVK